jgi:haloacetate dehalogenase
MDFSLGFWVWSFLAAPAPMPETLVVAEPAVFVEHMLDGWSTTPDGFPEELRRRYISQEP